MINPNVAGPRIESQLTGELGSDPVTRFAAEPADRATAADSLAWPAR